MKERALIYLVVVLVVINVAALGTIIYQRVTNPFWIGRHSEEIGVPPEMSRDFHLKPEQREAMRESRRRIDSLITPIHTEIGQKRQELLKEMESSQPDISKVDQLVAEIGALQVTIEKTLIHSFLEDSKTFSPEQRATFLKMINKRAKWQDKPMMGLGQGRGQGMGQSPEQEPGQGPGPDDDRGGE
jgi:uncharacterized membrane protein